MFRKIKQWFVRERTRRAASISAWAGMAELGDDGFSQFERQAIAALETITGRLTLVRSEGDMHFLTGTIPNTSLTLYLYEDEAQVSGPDTSYRKERWDFDRPAESIDHLGSFIRVRLQSNKSLERTRGG